MASREAMERFGGYWKTQDGVLMRLGPVVLDAIDAFARAAEARVLREAVILLDEWPKCADIVRQMADDREAGR